MTADRIVVLPSGDSAVRVVATHPDREAGWRLVHRLAAELDRSGAPGVIGSIPTYDALLVEVDPVRADLPRLESLFATLAAEIDVDQPLSEHPREFDVPVLYDVTETPDLQAVADIQGLGVADVVRLHSEPRYVVRCLGAPGGSPMLDGPAFPKPVPRRASPRTSVPQGMVSVAGRQATITPAVAPGGWPLIGRTPLTVLDLTAEPLVPYAPGDVIVFHPIDRAEFDRLHGRRMAAR
ncbi:5-oxoprolinase subunit B family protein [Microbacterium sp.]|uniref:5-oxoprolinase subunit B family protein n=1 Tax=Microbacterium sp. TaxID=51671 RepID=UPI003C710339